MTKGQLATEVLKLIKTEHSTPKAQLSILDEVRNLIEDARQERLKELEAEMKELQNGAPQIESYGRQPV